MHHISLHQEDLDAQLVLVGGDEPRGLQAEPQGRQWSHNLNALSDIKSGTMKGLSYSRIGGDVWFDLSCGLFRMRVKALEKNPERKFHFYDL